MLSHLLFYFSIFLKRSSDYKRWLEDISQGKLYLMKFATFKECNNSNSVELVIQPNLEWIRHINAYKTLKCLTKVNLNPFYTLIDYADTSGMNSERNRVLSEIEEEGEYVF